MNLKRLKEVQTWGLKNGSHKSVQDGLCINEAAAYIAGEPHSDHPKCVCPVITDYSIRINDRVDSDTRQKLMPLIPLMIGTKANKAVQLKRAKFLVHRTLTITLPILTGAIGLPEVSIRLRSCKNTKSDFKKIAAYLREQKPNITKAAADAAADAAAYAAAATAYAADAAATAAAYAAAATAYAADAAAAAAKWKKVHAEINDSAIETLRLVCGIK